MKVGQEEIEKREEVFEVEFEEAVKVIDSEDAAGDGVEGEVVFGPRDVQACGEEDASVHERCRGRDTNAPPSK